MARVLRIIFALCAVIAIAAAASPTFCKCTCFTNSTIIPLGPGHGSNNDNNPAPPPPPPPPPPSDDAAPPSSGPGGLPATHLARQKREGTVSCMQCNRAFCLGYNLPICAGAEDKDVMTMCFQRDSRKDQLIVWGFILGTAGLLGWAGARRAIEMREGRKGGRGGGLGTGGAAAGGALRSPGLRRPGAGERDEGARGGYRPVGVEGEGRASG